MGVGWGTGCEWVGQYGGGWGSMGVGGVVWGWVEQYGGGWGSMGGWVGQYKCG